MSNTQGNNQPQSQQTPSGSAPCPKCRTLHPENCHSMYCPMRPSNELAKTESGWRIGGTNESESVTSPGYSTAIFDENETFIARSFGYTYDESNERAKLICKQAKLVAGNQKLREYITAEREISQRFTDENAKLRSERDKMREALEASKIALEILEQVHDEFLPHTIVKFKKAKKLYESALSGGSKQ